jgi:serine/threonine protein kinase
MSTVLAPINDPAPAQHPLLGTTLRGTYRILRQLDQGGMGMVFEAEHVRLRRRVAVKVLAQHLAKDALIAKLKLSPSFSIRTSCR